MLPAYAPGMRKECLTAETIASSSTLTAGPATCAKDSTLLRRPQHMLQLQPADGSAKAVRPKTPITLAVLSECDRIRQLDGERPIQNRLTSHLPVRKSAAAKSAQSYSSQGDQVTQSLIQVAPGFLLARSKQKLRVTLKDEFFNPSHSEKKSQSPHIDPEIQQLLEDLKQQVADLSLFLEEERLDHNRTRKQAAELLRDKIEELRRDHDETLRQQKEWQAEDVARLQEAHDREMENAKVQTDSTIARLRSEVDFLQSAFNTFKTQANIEYQNSLHEHDDELKEKHEQQLQVAIDDLKMRLTSEKNAEKAKLQKEHAKELARLQKEHRREIEALNRKYSSHAEDLEALDRSKAELQDEKQKLVDLQVSYKNICQELASLQQAYNDTKLRLNDYERNFQLKIQQVDEKYQQKMDDLMKTNTELRQMYLKKCDELFKAIASAETTNLKRVATAKDVMKMLIELRHKADVSMAAADPRLARVAPLPKERPCSAPLTKEEREKALLSAGETQDYVAAASRPHAPFVRPHTSVVDFIRLRNPDDPFADATATEQHS